MEIPNETKSLLLNQQYRFVGKHSAVKICAWTRKSIVNQGVCYKEKFYGIRSHLCCQMSPDVCFCPNRCVICWRPVEKTLADEMDESDADSPEEIIKKASPAQRALLSGFGGNPDADTEKLEQAKEPMHYAISLAGEPTAYPRLNELIRLLHSKGKTTFVVTNGMFPEKLESIEPPTQLYLSVDAPSEELLKKVDMPRFSDAWQRLNKSLDIMKNMKSRTRTSLRITLIKGVNICCPEKYAELIMKADPLFVEVKAYMHVGASQQRLDKKCMPYHQEVVEFAEKIEEFCGYKIIDDQPESRVVLMMKKDFPERIMKF